MADDERRNPDELLAEVQREEARARRGRLRIFFGASAGVGKTYSMLEAARVARAGGTDVVVGYVEPHGRVETERLLETLEQLPLLEVRYHGLIRREFDLDAALQRAPAIILVDELAHSNLTDGDPPPRHAKRWQDIDELRDAGISVWTTVNVQHLESLNDVVASITGVRQQETVPDHVFESANDVELIDLPIYGRAARTVCHLGSCRRCPRDPVRRDFDRHVDIGRHVTLRLDEADGSLPRGPANGGRHPTGHFVHCRAGDPCPPTVDRERSRRAPGKWST